MNFKDQGLAMLVWGIALFLPVLLFVVIGHNLNERQPILPFITCPFILAGAARLTSDNWKFWCWGGLGGIIYACMLVFMV